jgi:hypothetical protein
MEGSCRWNRRFRIRDVAVNLPSDERSFDFIIQEGHELGYVSFRKLFSSRVNDPPAAYIVHKSPKDFGRQDSTVVVNILAQGS